MNDDIIFYGAINNKNKNVQGYAYSVYGVDGVCATITTGCGGGHIPLILEGTMEEVKRIGNLYGEDRGTGFAGNVWDKDGISPTITTMQGGGREPMIIDTINDEVSEKVIVAMRGRNPENPTDRTPGIKTEQRLELAPQGVVNTLTTVQKDNLCLEIKQATKEGSIKCKVGGCYDASYPDSTTRRGRVQNGGDVTPTITAQGGENINYVETVYRIRKLTPKECWRLMGYTDEDFEKAKSQVSNTQLYKTAGNAIVKQVLMAIFLQMNIQSLKNWNDKIKEDKANGKRIDN